MKSIIKKSICYLLVTMLLIANSSTTILAIDYYPDGFYIANYETMNVRSGSGLNYPVVGTLYKDQGVYVWGTITIDGIEWGKINISGGEDFDVYVRITGGYLVRE